MSNIEDFFIQFTIIFTYYIRGNEMKCFKSICVISAVFFLISCNKPYVKNKTPKTTVTKKTIPSKTTKKPAKEKPITKTTDYAVIHYVNNNKYTELKNELLADEMDKINSKIRKDDKVKVISLLSTDDKYSSQFQNLWNKFFTLNLKGNPDSLINSQAVELAGKILLVKDEKISVITSEQENLYLAGALLYIKKTYPDYDKLNIDIYSIESPFNIGEYTKEYKNLHFKYYKIQEDKLIEEKKTTFLS